MNKHASAGCAPGPEQAGAAGGADEDMDPHEIAEGLRAERLEALRLRERVSALMDGETPPGPHREFWAELVREPEARAAWLRYHRLGDWLRSPDLHGGFDEAAFLRRFDQRLRAEPVRFAPGVLCEESGAASWWRAKPWAGALGVALAGLATMVLACALLPQQSAPWGPPEPVRPQASAGAWARGAFSSGAGTAPVRVSVRGRAPDPAQPSARLAQGTCLPVPQSPQAAGLHALR
jgi:hypothetical protein